MYIFSCALYCEADFGMRIRVGNSITRCSNLNPRMKRMHKENPVSDKKERKKQLLIRIKFQCIKGEKVVVYTGLVIQLAIFRSLFSFYETPEMLFISTEANKLFINHMAKDPLDDSTNHCINPPFSHRDPRDTIKKKKEWNIRFHFVIGETEIAVALVDKIALVQPSQILYC